MRVYMYGILFLVVSNVLDVYYTHKVLSEGIAIEANPLMHWVITHFGFGGLAFVKGLAVVTILGLLLAVHKKLGKIPEIVAALFWGSVFAYGLLSAYHISIQVMT